MASSDIHSPRYINIFKEGLKKVRKECEETKIFILAGDIVFKGRLEAARHVFTLIQEYCGELPVIAIFGNEEFIGMEEKFKKRYSNIIWLDDAATTLRLEGKELVIYGTRGVLDRPTKWQRKNIPSIWKTYRNRLKRIENYLNSIRERARDLIFVTHYVPSYKLLQGEPPYAWPEMGSNELGKILITAKPRLVIYGHAHNAKIYRLKLDGVLFINVALPARKTPVYISREEIFG